MRLRILNCSLSIFVITALSNAISAQEMLEPPFGLRWGDSPEKLVQWANRLSLNITISLPGDQPALRILKIGSYRGNLPGNEVNEIEGKFISGKLYEVTVHYYEPELPLQQMETRFKLLKRQVSIEQGELQIDQDSKIVSDNFLIQKTSYRRETIKGLHLLLVSTSIEDMLRKSQSLRFSLVYQNVNLLQESGGK
jgi:hypothetical protein